MNSIQKIAPLELVAAKQRTTMDLVQDAVMGGAGIDVIERLMKLHENYEAGQAKKDFYAAKAAFKADAPDISKDMDNTQYSSKYTSIGNLVTNINKALSLHGLDAQWDIEQTDKIKVTCILTHMAGHQEKVSMTAPPDDSGKKNPIQQIKSTITYLKVATYEAVTGTASKEGNADDDGNALNGEPETVSEVQLQELLDLADELHVNKALFCRWAKIGAFSDILANDFEKAKRAILAKRKDAAHV